jgi:predicted anti-sigma-YlaC factor YlaD
MRWLDGLKVLLLMTCRDAAPLIALGMDQKLAAQDHTAVRLHLAICRSCRRYRGQLALLRRVLALFDSARLRSGGQLLSPEARARIQAELDRRSA